MHLTRKPPVNKTLFALSANGRAWRVPMYILGVPTKARFIKNGENCTQKALFWGLRKKWQLDKPLIAPVNNPTDW
jgi:hypothetical protein